MLQHLGRGWLAHGNDIREFSRPVQECMLQGREHLYQRFIRDSHLGLACWAGPGKFVLTIFTVCAAFDAVIAKYL
jgi:hypothetical protein